MREAGSGHGVVCMHSNASSSSQWRGLMDLLAPRYRVLAPALPRVEVLEFDKLGHMGPITHPDVVNPEIAGFLEQV